MVDMDKHVCRQLTENGYKNGQWPESYITWEFLADHPRAMESGYFHVDWNSIPRLYNHKSYLRTLAIEKEGVGSPKRSHSATTLLGAYSRSLMTSIWTLGLALCWTPFHDCPEPA